MRGVSFDSNTKRWKARVTIDGVAYHLGNYPSQDEAAKAYKTCVTFRDPVSYALNMRRAQGGVRKYAFTYYENKGETIV